MKKILMTVFLVVICTSVRAEEQPKSVPPRIILNKHIWPNFDSVKQGAITDRDYEYIVEKVIKDKDGKITLTPANLTDWGTQVFTGFWTFFRFFYRDLKPGDTEQDKIVISRLFDMTMPGTYSIKVNCYAT